MARVNGLAASVGTEITLASGAKVQLNANGSYTYKPNGAFEGLDTGETATDTFKYNASDSTAVSNEATVTITITGVNDAPTVVITGATSVSESGVTAHTYGFNTTDPDANESFTRNMPSCGASGELVLPVNFDSDSGDGSFVCLFRDDVGPAGTAVDVSQVSITITDNDGQSGTGTLDVTVNNVAPAVTITAGPTSVDEGHAAVTYSYSWTDPGADTWTKVTSCGATGVKSAETFDTTLKQGSFKCAWADDVGLAGTSFDVETVSITVSDDDSGSDTETRDVTVNNVAPAVTITAGPTSVDEGHAAVTYSYSWTDPGADTWTKVTSCGATGVKSAETFDTTLKQGSFKCAWADDVGLAGTSFDVETVSITVSDDDSGSDTETRDVTVNNVAPAVTITAGPTSVDEGHAAVTYSYSWTDPGADTWTKVTSCGATGVKSAETFDTTLKQGSFKCAWADDVGLAGTSFDVETVSITVSDDDSGSDTETRDVTVNNVAPAVTITAGPTSVDEGHAAVTYSYSWTDPGADTWTKVTSCGATGVKSAETFDTTLKQGSFKCAWADDVGLAGTSFDVETVSITVSDDDTGSDTETRDVTVNNVAPAVTITAGPTSVDEGHAAVTYSYSWTDPGADTWTKVTSCGATGVKSAETFDTTLKQGSFKCAWADDVGLAGTSFDVETVSITVSDDDSGSDTETRDVTVNNVAPAVTITAGPTSVDEGHAAVTYSYSWTDPGADTWTKVTSCGATGVKSAETFDTTLKQGSFKCAWADDVGLAGTSFDVETVSITVSDDDSGSDTETRDVTVNNVAPAVTITAGPTSVDEGHARTPTATPGPIRVPTPGPRSPAAAPPASRAPRPSTPPSSTGSFKCAWADDVGLAGTSFDVETVSITVSDDDSGSDTETHDVTVNNVAPAVTITAGPTSVDEGHAASPTATPGPIRVPTPGPGSPAAAPPASRAARRPSTPPSSRAASSAPGLTTSAWPAQLRSRRSASPSATTTPAATPRRMR